MLKTIKLCFTHNRWIDLKGEVGFASGMNTIIGPNGSGKTSILRAIAECPACRRVEEGKGAYRLFDAERMNPHSDPDQFKGPRGWILQSRAMFSSHGEIMRAVMSTFPFRNGDVLLFDEPEAGNDIEWIQRIQQGMLNLAGEGCQIIVATHHPVFLKKAHLIELKKNYAQTLRKIYRSLL